MENNKNINDSQLEKVTGGSRGPEGWGCDRCGRRTSGDDIETYEIRIDYKNPGSSEYLRRKDVCRQCRNTHLEEYISKHGWGYVDGIFTKGPL